MAHWAEVDESNIVKRVIVADNYDTNGDEGYQWIIDNLGGTWVKTSYNTQGGVHVNGGIPLRYNFAGIGYLYDPIRDAFIPPQPHPSWVLNQDTLLFEAPVPYPIDGKWYAWNEETISWDLIPLENA